MQPDWPIANTTVVAKRSEIGILFDWLVTGSASSPTRRSLPTRIISMRAR
jgi:hypothetical protein